MLHFEYRKCKTLIIINKNKDYKEDIMLIFEIKLV